MGDLAAFILARIEEDEAAAEACAEAFPAPWDVIDRGRGAKVQSDAPNFWPVSEIDQEQETEGRWPGEHLEHIARHDPARVLAQCAALRAVVNEAAALLDSWDHVHEGTAGLAMWPDVNRRERSQAHRRLRALASIWSSHPDYPLED